MRTGYVWNERFAWHDAGSGLGPGPYNQPYPALDRPESKRRLHGLVDVSGLLGELRQIDARHATEEELQRFHTPDYVRKIRDLSEGEGGNAGEAARFGHGGFDIARLAVGGVLEATDAVVRGDVENAYALVRPCGHHAEADRGRGFCIFGNVTLAVKHAREAHQVERLAVVDWDVHHGNGTQDAFYADPDVLTISLHQDRNYPPDSGSVDETGVEAGRGRNINVPLPPGSGHGAYLAALDRIVAPAVTAFAPDLIFVSCGYDAAASDPLGRMMCHSGTFREMMGRVLDVAAESCEGRVVVCHEGGYSPTYAPFCGLAVIECLSGISTDVDDPMLGWYESLGGQELLDHQEAVIATAAALAGLED